MTNITINQKKLIKKKKFKNELEVLPFLLPGLILMGAFVLFPLFKNIYMSMTDFNILQFKANDFIWLDNYIKAFNDPKVPMIFTNTILYGLVTVPPQIILGLIIANILNTKIKGSFFFRILFYIPVITSWLVVSLIFRYLFESGDGGLINYFVMKLHLIKEPIAWFTERWTSNIVIWLLGVWKGIGWVMVIYLAGLQGIDKTLYEAAEVDGANGYQKLRYITIPELRPITFFIVTNLIIGSFSVFIQVIVMTNGAPMGRTEVLLTYMYKVAFDQFNFGYSAALSILIGLFVFMVTFGQRRLTSFFENRRA